MSPTSCQTAPPRSRVRIETNRPSSFKRARAISQRHPIIIYERDRVVAFVGQAEVARAYSEVAHQDRHGARANAHGFAGRVVDHANIGETDAIAETGAERLYRCLFCGETLGKKTGGLPAGSEGVEFRRCQYSAHDALPVALPAGAHTIDPNDIGADAVDPRPRAAHISRFISYTASRRPVNSARAMIAWPMLSSRSAGMAATAMTLW